MSSFDSNDLVCSQCQRKIGNIVFVSSEEFLQLGGIILREAHGNCIQCGAGFHYSLNEKRLKQIIQRVMSHQENR